LSPPIAGDRRRLYRPVAHYRDGKLKCAALGGFDVAGWQWFAIRLFLFDYGGAPMVTRPKIRICGKWVTT
jgi:hypothetical protein